MSLPWVRIDTNLASHQKILSLVLQDAHPQRWRAAFSYVCGIGWSAGSSSDGLIPPSALPFIHGNTATAGLLIAHHLWDTDPEGYRIHNYAVRQELAIVVDAKQEMRAITAAKAACRRWHGPGCWTANGCSRATGT